MHFELQLAPAGDLSSSRPGLDCCVLQAHHTITSLLASLLVVKTGVACLQTELQARVQGMRASQQAREQCCCSIHCILSVSLALLRKSRLRSFLGVPQGQIQLCACLPQRSRALCSCSDPDFCCNLLENRCLLRWQAECYKALSQWRHTAG
jgi:hypothetical protein